MVPVRSLRSPDAACGGAAEPGVMPLYRNLKLSIIGHDEQSQGCHSNRSNVN